MARVSNFSRLWGIVVWCLALGWLGQVDSGLEYENLITEVVGSVGSGLVGLHLRSEPMGELFSVSSG